MRVPSFPHEYIFIIILGLLCPTECGSNICEAGFCEVSNTMMEEVLSHRFDPEEVNISFTSAEEPWSTRTGSWLRLTASRSKKLILWTEKWEPQFNSDLIWPLRGKAEDAGSWRIVLGKHQLKRSEVAERIFPVKRIYRHENFRYPAHSELDYDIALVKAATDINPSNFIRYACLPRKQTSLNPGHYCWVTGWGDTRGEWRPSWTVTESVTGVRSGQVRSGETKKRSWSRP